MSRITLIADSISHPGQGETTHWWHVTFAENAIPDFVVDKWAAQKNKSYYNLTCVLDNFVPDWQFQIVNKVKLESYDD